LYFDLIYFKNDSTLWCLSFNQHGAFKFLQWKTPKTSDKPECVLISRDGSHILYEKTVRSETNANKPEIEKKPEIAPAIFPPKEKEGVATPQAPTDNKEKPPA